MLYSEQMWRENIDGHVAGERREPKSTAGAPEREEAGEREAT